MCLSCFNRRCHVQIAGNSLANFSSEQLKRLLLRCSVIKPIHVIKHEANCFALIHFGSAVDAATFFHIYSIQRRVVCNTIRDITVNPSLIGREPVVYSRFQVQPRIRSSTGVFCRCPPTTAISTSTTPAISNGTPPAISNTTAISDEEVNADIEKIKLKLKIQEKDKLSEEIM